LNKLLITIQGRTLILYYQIRQKPADMGGSRAQYIAVLPSAELDRFNLKGLTPEMFCVNIADMVNIRGLYSGQVENERQVPVAKWEMNYDEYLELKNNAATPLTHREIVNLLAALPGYVQETDDQYIEFEERVVPHETGDHATFSGYRLTVMTEEIEDQITTSAFYYLDTCTAAGWQGYPPPQADFEAIQIALKHTLDAISAAGVDLLQVSDETDYAIVADGQSN
jgi:hypothetical protein